ncbi:hypothetical protein PCANC_23278 [Puccinia coronata f. sp. avenae]|uniref:Uncharacterized protein n=1 Tax=Puccinia coronata f. sp. avenae TaxID=200324 RepID=A0A2N5TY47_9BASI|nr:hypothetical protein PCANC_23278 [Puccinia coronata f. sp. avenae]
MFYRLLEGPRSNLENSVNGGYMHTGGPARTSFDWIANMRDFTLFGGGTPSRRDPPKHNASPVDRRRRVGLFRAVLEQPCLTGGRTGTVRPKQEPTGRTDLSDRSRLVLCDRSQELIRQACPTRRQVLRSDSACPTTGRTRLFEHRSNCRVRPVNAGSAVM